MALQTIDNSVTDSIQALYLKPGELTLLQSPTLVSTVLGSCVAITLYCARLRFGAICHAVFPVSHGINNFKYLDCALNFMLCGFDEHGICRRDIIAKLFGGADMFDCVALERRTKTVGWQNILVAKEELQRHGVWLHASDTGGYEGRRLLFNSDSGEVFLKRVTGPDAKVSQKKTCVA